ncbi:host specificity factor TipJ family phage tail protein [uncultured Comamonas sp.]|uniref:host specificity factor TipJ family phage tail protein n=1 Tax=uncultured Comamonas sp. TaxID=114710 RepID=UPI00259910C7|nr:host specificity factor TipJ family phage tail protein [uncultured Comamonas sp.]
MEVTKAEIDAVLDAQGRFVWTPNALTLDGQQNVPCDLQPGESLEAFLRRHVPGIDSGAWSVSIGGCVVPRAMWGKAYPKHGMHIACRATVGKQAVQLVAVAALAYFSGGLAAGLYGAMGGTYVAANAGLMLSALQMGVFVAGSILINKVLGPKTPKAGTPEEAKQVYSLRSQRNSARPYESVPVLFGEMRVTPDLAGHPYAWYESDDQYMSTILLGGVNVHSAADLSIGDTPIGSYSDVEVMYSQFPGMTHQPLTLASNVDTTPGGELPESGDWVTRTTSVDTTRIGVDYELQLYAQGNAGLKHAVLSIEVFYRAVGTSTWIGLVNNDGPGKWGHSNNTTEVKRFSFSKGVPQGQYEVRTRRLQGAREKVTAQATWVSLRSHQPNTADHGGLGRIGIKIKATGQISGSLDTVRATYRAKPMPIWNGSQWVTATNRENGLSNPGAIILQTLRGIWHNGKLQFGFGLSDDQIDIEGLKAFMLHCTANGYTYDRWITSSVSLHDFCQEVALAGMGEFSWTDGSRPTVVFVSAGQPVSAVVNMANMLKASFSVDYALSNAADGIEYQYVDRTKNFETVTLRVAAPGVTTALNPARIKGDGVTTEAHAAIMARYHLAQSLFQYKTINFGADIEHLDYRRLSVLSVSHDLTQWGYGGRVMGAWRSGGQVLIQLDESVPPLPTPHLGLRLPGDRDYRVFAVQTLEEASDTLVLTTPWPAGVALPGEGDDAHDTLWCYDFKATPGYRVRVTSMEPEQDLKGAKVTCVPEGPEFWDYVLNGTYVPAPSQSALPELARPQASGLRVREQVNVQGNTQWYSLNLVWDTTGEVDHCQVWAGIDGSELRLVDALAVGNRSSVRIEEQGQWLLRVVPFDASGKAGQGTSLLYITTQVGLAPWAPEQFVVQTLEGGLRRFAWQWASDRPADLAGVQIRCQAGSGADVSEWDAMQPLGDASDVYTAQFETTRPDGGLWTFGLRAINTSGQLSAQMRTFTIELPQSLPQIQAPDDTPPPVPTGLSAVGAFATVQVSWDAPVYMQGHGHARTEVWAGATADRADATKVAEAYAGPVAFEWPLGAMAHIWARHVTVDGVVGDWAGPVTAQTAQDIEQVTDLLKGQFDESHLKQALVKRIDAIDVGSPELGKSLIESAASIEATQQKVRTDMEDMARGLLEAALAADGALERLTDAGIVVDPVSGVVRNYALEATKDEVTQLEVLLDAVQGQLALKATTAYVDGKIAQAVLSPADLLLYEGLDARLIEVAQTLDSINGTLTQKASALELQSALVRLSTAESSLDALSGQIALRVTRAEYEADQNALASRLSSAELTLNALDVPSIQATVQAASSAQKDAEKQAQALLQDILTGERNRTEAQQALAFARSELSASIQEGLQAEAQQRTQLAVQFGQQMSAVEQSLSSLSAADVAEAAARLALAAKVEREQQQLQAQIETESQARADAVSAEAQQRQQLAARLDQEDDALLALVEQEEQARVSGDQAEAQARQALAARLDQADTSLQAAVQSEQTARVNADGALSQRIDTAQATANNAVAAVQTEQSVRANETGHLGALYSVRMQLSQGGKQVIGGFGLSGTSSGTAGATIDFGVLANKFFVAAPEGSGIASNFQLTIQTTPTTANGVTIPAGLYVDSAFITNVSALWGRFGTLVADSIQATAISASQLTAGNGVIGGTLKSSNYVAGSSGWTLRPDGVAEFSGVIVRGTVYATSGTVGGWELSGDRIRSAGFTANSGVELRSDGHVYARNAATNVTFNTAATGTGEVLRVGSALVINAQGDAIFGGSLSARVINTNNIVGDAVVRSWAGTTAGPIPVGNAATGGSWQGAHTTIGATAGRPLIISAAVTYDMADNWYAAAYGNRDQRFYLSVYCDRHDAAGNFASRVELFGVEAGRAIRLETAVITYGIGQATNTFRAIAQSVLAGGFNRYFVEVRCAGIGFVVRHASLVVQEQRI